MSAEMISHFLEALARVSGQAAVLVLLVLLVQRVFRGWLTPGWRSALWLLVIARMLMPVSLPSRVSVFNCFPKANPTGERLPQPVVSVAEATLRSGMQHKALPEFRVEDMQQILSTSLAAMPLSQSSSPTSSLQHHVRRVSWPIVIFSVWLAGTLVLTGHVLVTWLRTTRRFRGVQEASVPESLALLEECRMEMRVRTRLKIVESAGLRSPALNGVLRPRLLLPIGFTRSFTPSELRFVFLHELAHVKRQDVLLSWLVALLQIVHWFNPLLWFGFKRWRADRELACDALALEVAGEGCNKEYGRTILRLLENLTHRVAAPGLVGILEDKRQLQQRIGMIAAFVPQRRWSIPAVALLLALALVGLTDASSADSPNQIERTAQVDPAASQTLPAIRNPRPSASTSGLQFRVVSEDDELGDVDEFADPKSQVGDASKLRLRKEALLDRSAIESAKMQTSAIGNSWELLITLTDTAAEKFSRFTEQNPFSRLALVLNDKVLLVVRINEKIVGKKMVISGNFAKAEAEAVVASFNADGHMERVNEARKPSVRTNRIHTGPGRQLIEHKLDTIKVEEVLYDGIPLGEVVKDLAAQARQRDPAKRGINIIVNSQVDVPPQSDQVEPAIANPLSASPPSEPLDLNTVVIRLALRDVTLGEVVDAIAKFAEKPLRYSIEEYAVVFTPGTQELQPLFTRIFKVDPNTFLQGLRSVMNFPLGDGGDSGTDTTSQRKNVNDIVRQFFAAVGVDFPTARQVEHSGNPLTGTRKALFYNDRTGLIYARAPSTDLDVMDKAIQVVNFSIAPPQITLEVKFVELPPEMPLWPSSMENTNAPDSHVIPVTGILTDPQFRVLIRSYEQRADVNVLAAPKVVTLGGRQARIELTELKSVVSGLADETSGAYSVTDVPTGPSIDVIPDVAADGQTIDLTVIANLIEFLGYDDPGPFSSSIPAERLQPVRPLPRFRVRNAMSTATVKDGQTLMLGGFVSQNLRDATNKVPVLGDLPLRGRLFRSDSSARTNKQLVVFVTPTIIDPAGNRVSAP